MPHEAAELRKIDKYLRRHERRPRYHRQAGAPLPPRSEEDDRLFLYALRFPTNELGETILANATRRYIETWGHPPEPL